MDKKFESKVTFLSSIDNCTPINFLRLRTNRKSLRPSHAVESNCFEHKQFFLVTFKKLKTSTEALDSIRYSSDTKLTLQERVLTDLLSRLR